MRYILLCSLIISTGPLNAQSYLFGKRLGGNSASTGTPSWDKGIGIDGTGNIYTLSSFSGIVDVDPGGAPVNFNSVNGSYVIEKLDAAGNFVWAKQFAQNVHSIAVDNSGNVLLTGTFKNTVDFDPGAGISNLTAFGYDDVYILKLDNAGNFQWAKQVGGNMVESSGYITVSSQGMIYVTGSFGYAGAGPGGSADFDPDPAVSYTLVSTGSADGFLLSLNGDGNFLWVRHKGGPDRDGLDQLTTDPTGNVIYTGALTPYNWFIEKVDAANNLLWTTNLHYGFQIFSIATDNPGNVLYSGNFSGTVDVDPGPSVKNFTATSAQDGFNAKLNANGSFAWATHIRANGTANSIYADANGNVYTTGHFGGNGNIDFDPGPGTFNVKAPARGMYILKLSGAGNFTWVKEISGDTKSKTYGRGIVLNPSGDIYTNFEFSGTVDVDPGIAKINLTSAGIQDKVIHKMTQVNNGLRESYVHTNQPSTELSISPLSIKGKPAFRIMNTYPNPNRGSFYVEIPAIGDNARLLIYDMAGKKVFTKTFDGHTDQKIFIDLPSKTRGNYIVEVKGRQQYFSVKVNVQ